MMNCVSSGWRNLYVANQKLCSMLFLEYCFYVGVETESIFTSLVVVITIVVVM
jgi:hypothetical protein